MKRLLLFTAAWLAAGLCAAQEEGLVISATPVVQQVARPRQVCTWEPVTVQPPRSGAGAAVGALAGGLVGNAATQGSGLGTVLGAVSGAVIGNQVEPAPPPAVQTVPRCGVQTFYEHRTVYDVEYEYGGRRYRVQLPYDPGQTLALRVAPEQLGEPDAPPPQPLVSAPPPGPPPAAVAPVYAPSYDEPYYYPAPPLGVQLYWGSHWTGYPVYVPRYVPGPRYVPHRVPRYTPAPQPPRPPRGAPPHLGRH